MPVKILISDDSPIFRRTLRNLLESEDHWQVFETGNGDEAVSQAGQLQPDVVILDLAMPVMDGLTAAREISKLLPDTPIVMCTMHNSPQMELEAKKAGIRLTISKANSMAIVPAIRQLVGATPAQVSGDATLAIPLPTIVPPPLQASTDGDAAEAASADPLQSPSKPKPKGA